MLRPRAGNALVRSIVADPIRPTSKILLLPDTVANLTAQQLELVAMGPPPQHDELDPADTARDAVVQGLPVGSWLVCRHRTWIETDVADHYVIPQGAILAVIR